MAECTPISITACHKTLRSMKRIALFGASFDPPTGMCGHGGIVNHIQELFSEIWLIPVYQHPYLSKRQRLGSLSSYDARLQMLHLQFSKYTNVKISKCEKDYYQKRENDGLRGEDLIFGTYDLIQYLNECFPLYEFHFVIGGDSLLDLINGKWRNAKKIMDEVPLVALNRVGYETEEINLDIFKKGIQLITVPSLTSVSSSQVRSLIEEGRRYDEYLDPSVATYIHENNLYSKQAANY